MSSTDRSPALGSLGAGIFLTSLGVLLLVVALTCIFSFTISYHFAYRTIRVALLDVRAARSIAGITWDFRGVTLLALAIYGAGVAAVLWARGASVPAIVEPRAAHSA